MQEALQARVTKKQKIIYWKQSGVWPWWIYHASEKQFWQDSTRENFEYDAARWRLSMDQWLDQPQGPRDGGSKEDALRKYNEKWIELYGQEAHDQAMEATQAAYERAKAQHGDYRTFCAAVKRKIEPGARQ